MFMGKTAKELAAQGQANNNGASNSSTLEQVGEGLQGAADVIFGFWDRAHVEPGSVVEVDETVLPGVPVEAPASPLGTIAIIAGLGIVGLLAYKAIK